MQTLKEDSTENCKEESKELEKTPTQNGQGKQQKWVSPNHGVGLRQPTNVRKRANGNQGGQKNAMRIRLGVIGLATKARARAQKKRRGRLISGKQSKQESWMR